jgi:hypothetical protein
MCHPTVTKTTVSRQISKSNKCQISCKSYQRVLALSYAGRETDIHSIGCPFINIRYERNNDFEWGSYDARLESMYFVVCIWESCGILFFGGGGGDRNSEKVEICIIS